MNALSLEPEVDPGEPEADDDQDDELVEGLSFFTDHGGGAAPLSDPIWDRVLRADELVQNRVWTMFAKASNSRGIACTERVTPMSTRAPDLKVIEKKEKAMGEAAELTERQRKVLDTYKTLKAKLGRLPTTPEIADVLKESPSALRRDREVLVEFGLAEMAPRGGPRDGGGRPPKVKTKVKANGVVNRGGARTVQPKPPRASSTDPTIAALIAKRDDLRKKAEALDVAIEALAVPL